MKYLKEFESLNPSDIPTMGDYVLYKRYRDNDYGIIRILRVDLVKEEIHFKKIGLREYEEKMPFSAFEENIEKIYVGRILDRANEILKKIQAQNRFDL